MGHEIEAKLRVSSLEKVCRLLDRQGARFVGELYQLDSYYDDDNSALLEHDCGLRIRQEKNANKSRFLLTYKGPRHNHNFKKRVEIEFEVSDQKAAREFLNIIGYVRIMTVEKKRGVWEIGGCEVACDQVTDLGDFVEIEGPNMQVINTVRDQLKLTQNSHIHHSYAHMMQEVQKEK